MIVSKSFSGYFGVHSLVGTIMAKIIALAKIVLIVLCICIGLFIAYAVLLKLRANAKTALCSSYLVRWSVVMGSYANDNEGFFPSHTSIISGGANPWDISVETKEVLEGYGAGEVWICPAISSRVQEQIKKHFDLLESRSPEELSMVDKEKGFYIIPGYFLWVPRPMYETNEIYPDNDIITGKPFPRHRNDESAKYLPIMTDAILKGTQGQFPDSPYCSSDLNDGAPIDYDWSSIVWEARINGVYANHEVGGKVINTNHLYSDGHIETHPASEIRTRYKLFYQNLF